MKKSTKILLVIWLLLQIPAIVLGRYVFAGIKAVDGAFTFNLDARGIAGIVLMILASIFGTILYFRFLKSLTLSKMIFFSTIPMTLIYGVGIFALVELSHVSNNTASSVRTLLNITPENNYNTILWAVLLSIIYIAVLFFSYLMCCKPVSRVEKIVSRLSDGKVREERFNVGGGKQFKSMEHALNKINNNYKDKDNTIKKANIEAQKFIPKQFLKFLGKSSITELELGNQVQKHATTLFCNLKSITENKSLSLEENFNFINSYMNVISPLIRRYNGFVDKYSGDGLLAVFARPESSLDCAHAIIRAIETKNRSQKLYPSVVSRISLHTGDVIFGIVGEEEQKSPTIISDVLDLSSKIEEINNYLQTKLIFSKAVLDELPIKYKLLYRYLGSLNMEEGKDLPLFESIEVYSREKRERLREMKGIFENAVKCYNERNFQAASSGFEEVLRVVPNDKPSYIYFNKAKEKLASEEG